MRTRLTNLAVWAGILVGAEILVAAGIAWVQYLRAPSLRLGSGYPDFLLFYAIARLEQARGFQHLYDPAAVLQFERLVTGAPLHSALPMSWPPFVAILARPLALADFKTAYIAWALLSAAMLALAIHLLVRTAGLRGRGAWAAGLLAAAWLPVLAAVLQGQLAGPALLGMALAALYWARAAEWRAGAGALLTLPRFHLVLLLPVLFLVRRAWRALAFVVTGTAAVVLATLPFTGLGAWVDYAGVLLPAIQHGNRGFAEAEQAPYALRGLIEAVAGASALDVILPALLLLGVAAVIALKPSAPRLDMALVAVASLDASLHQNLHDLTLVLVALILVAGALAAGRLRHPRLGWAAIAAGYAGADLALFSPLLPALALQVLLAYLLLERLRAEPAPS